MSFFKKIFYIIFPKVEIESDFTEKELNILKEVGFKAFSQEDLKRMNRMKLEMRRIEKEERSNTNFVLAN